MTLALLAIAMCFVWALRDAILGLLLIPFLPFFIPYRLYILRKERKKNESNKEINYVPM